MITNFRPQNFTGDFEVSENNYTISGTFTAGANKAIINCNGSVKDAEMNTVFNFNGWQNGEDGSLVYNFDSVSDVAAMSSALAAFKNGMGTVASDVAAQE